MATNRTDRPDKLASGSRADADPRPLDAEASEPATQLWARSPHAVSPTIPDAQPRQTEPKRTRQRKVPLKRRLRRWACRIAMAASILLGLGFLAFAALIWHYGQGLPETADLKNYNPPQVTRILARDGTPLAELFTVRRTVVPIASVP